MAATLVKVQATSQALTDKVNTWADVSGKVIHDAAVGEFGLKKILEVIENSTKAAEGGYDAVVQASQVLGTLGAQLDQIFLTFKPLITDFQSKLFFVKLLSNPTHVQALVSVVEQLLNTSVSLHALGQVCESAESALDRLSDTYGSAMNKLSEKEKRQLRAQAEAEGESHKLEFFTYKRFLEGIDFDGLRAVMAKFRDDAEKSAKALSNANATLFPLLKKVDELAGLDLTDLKEGEEALTAWKLYPKDYQSTIESIVPTWQAVEGIHQAVCNSLGSADHEASALVCRVRKFLEKKGLIGLPALLAECPVSTVVDRKCPQILLSDVVAKEIMQQSLMLGWLMYVLAAVLSFVCCGVTVLAAVKKLRAATTASTPMERQPLAHE